MQIEECTKCGGNGEFRVTFRDPDDRPNVYKTQWCKACNGRGTELSHSFGCRCHQCLLNTFWEPEPVTTTLYAFEYCNCIYESTFAVVSLHSTKRNAYKAMMLHKNLHWYEARRFELRWGREMYGWRDGQHHLSGVAYRVRAIEVQD